MKRVGDLRSGVSSTEINALRVLDFTADGEGCEVLPTRPRSATGEKAISYRWQRNPLELESNYWIWPKNELSKCEDLIYKSYLGENQC